MKVKVKLLLNLTLFSLLGFTACQQNAKEGTTKSGIKYKFFEKNQGKKIEGGDFIDFHMQIRNANDSVVESTYAEGREPYQNQPFPKDTANANVGTLFEAFEMMAQGDSAQFMFSTDTLLAQNRRRMRKNIDMMKQQMEAQIEQAPNDSLRKSLQQQMEARIKMAEAQLNQETPDLPKGKFITYTVKVLAIKDSAQVEKEKQEAIQKQKEEDAQRKKDDDDAIQKYAKENKLDVQSTGSGLYYAITEPGSGPKPQVGDQVKVNYVGQTIEGVLFDTSLEEVAKEDKEVYNPDREYEPFTFTIGRREVIPGWDEGLQQIPEGSKAKLLIPSHLAYGARGGGRIPPYSILVFEVELLEVNKANPQ